jgi:hypothetical protein
MMSGNNINKGDGHGKSKKSSLVQGELADLKTRRGSKENGTSGGASTGYGTKNCWDEIHYSLKVVRRNPRGLLLPLFVFAILSAGGLALIFILAKGQDDNDKDTASPRQGPR